MKIVKELLIEFKIWQATERLKNLEGVITHKSMVDNLSKYINNVRLNGVKFPGESRGWVKPFLSSKVLSQPLLIKDVDKIIGIALHIGYDTHNKDIKEYLCYKHDIQYKKFEFEITSSPAFRTITKGPYPKKVIEHNYQLAIHPTLSHIKHSNMNLVYEKLDKIKNDIVGIVYINENTCVASITKEGKIIFNFEVAIKNLKLDEIEDMWKRGLINKKN